MLAPPSPEIAGEITGEQLDTLLDRLLERHTYVVADTWSFLDEVAWTLLRRADELVVVTTPEVPSLSTFLSTRANRISSRGESRWCSTDSPVSTVSHCRMFNSTCVIRSVPTSQARGGW
jgi:hypothetical protein